MDKNPLRSAEEEMGPDASLDFDKICEIVRCPTRSMARGSHRRDDLLVLNDKFLEINFGKYGSVSCKSVMDRPMGIEGGLEVNRGSVYESLSEVGRTRNGMRLEQRRRKIELPRGSDMSSCLSIVDSLCSSDDEIKSSRSLVISSCSRATGTLKCNCSSQPSSAEGLRQNCNGRSGDTVRLFSKSFSVKRERPPPPFISESCRSSQSSFRTQFSPVKKMLDPLVKSKLLRSPLSHTSEDRAVSNYVMEQGKFEECRFRMSPWPSTKDSPVQLHGLLERKEKHRVPLFEFSVDCPEEALIAKTWKENKSFDWVYTFHSLNNRRKTFAEGKVSEDCCRESVMIGQMQVCCHIYSEPRSDGSFQDSSVTEFVLYDTAHIMRSTSPSRLSLASAGRTYSVDDIGTATKLQHGMRRNTKGRDHPLASVELGPELEVAATLVRVPYTKSESLGYKRGDNSIADSVNIVIPAGNHGLPTTKGSGPSPLLERWRKGGGCDCRGWDMACPLVILGNPSIKFDDRIIIDEDKPLRLHVQGTKDRIPALTMKFLEEGFYEIDFHARLSSLQAFSICVAMLHSIDAIKASRDEDERNLRHGDSPEMLVKEGRKFSVDPIWKMVNVTAPSYLINPPFSPIARV